MLGEEKISVVSIDIFDEKILNINENYECRIHLTYRRLCLSGNLIYFNNYINKCPIYYNI